MIPRISGRTLRYAGYGLLALTIGLIALSLLNRANSLYKQAERLMVMGEINAMRGAVTTMLDPLNGTTARSLNSLNPVQFLRIPPKNYLGSIPESQIRTIPRGSWYFRPKRGQLVYKAHYAHKFPFFREPVRKLRLTLTSPYTAKHEPQQRLLACGLDICLTVRKPENSE
jgi:hypothetical protein